MLAFFGKDTYGCIGKLLPAAALVRTCLVGLYGKRGIEQQHALFGPAVEVAGGGGAGGTGTPDWIDAVAGKGGNGDKQVQIFYLGVASPYTAKIGAGGKNCGKKLRGCDGGAGGSSSFKIEGIIDIK